MKKTGQEWLKFSNLGFCQDRDTIKKDKEAGKRKEKSQDGGVSCDPGAERFAWYPYDWIYVFGWLLNGCSSPVDYKPIYCCMTNRLKLCGIKQTHTVIYYYYYCSWLRGLSELNEVIISQVLSFSYGQRLRIGIISKTHVSGTCRWLSTETSAGTVGQDTGMFPLPVAWSSSQPGAWVPRTGIWGEANEKLYCCLLRSHTWHFYGIQFVRSESPRSACIPGRAECSRICGHV